ncbi:MAG TPA: hydroxysqualene dehydroxylase HpnE [Candidatus Saccharimonadales bacterium]|nr:hydroxysqualene dehydroxylase HpnE [Candidatus Saccharimonadales bacterium]
MNGLVAGSKAVRPSVGIVGGGLAGLAAACALADTGYKVTLFERRPFLGGRASSYEHPGTGEVVDNCQHVLLGCCTNLRDLYRRLGVEDKVRWYRRITFIEPGGRSGVIEPSSLPAPLHSAISFAKYGLLSLRDKAGIARALVALLKGVPEDSAEDFLTWLRKKGQTQAAINRFWAPVLISSLNEELDKSSVKYAVLVFRDAFMKSAEAGSMGVPRIPLSELYGVAADYIRARGGEVRLRNGVEAVAFRGDKVKLRSNEQEFSFDYAISAVPFHAIGRMLPQSTEAEELQRKVSHLQTVPITGIHLWFDREVTELEHAALLDRTIQWMFQKSKILAGRGSQGAGQSAKDGGSYLELVVSSSKSLLEMGRSDIIALAMKELEEFFPKVRDAKLVKSTVIKEVHATFAPAPLSDEFRLRPQSAWPRLFLSGDWTATGWPSTMEGAVRAGYLTAEALSRAAGNSEQFMVPDLKPQGFMRLFPS